MLSPNNLFQPDVYVHTYVRSQLLWSLSLDDATLEVWTRVDFRDMGRLGFQTRE